MAYLIIPDARYIICHISVVVLVREAVIVLCLDGCWTKLFNTDMVEIDFFVSDQFLFTVNEGIT